MGPPGQHHVPAPRHPTAPHAICTPCHEHPPDDHYSLVNALRNPPPQNQLEKLQGSLKKSEDALSALEVEHKQLKEASAATIGQLTDRVNALAKEIDDLQRAKRLLTEQLEKAQADAALKQAAEARVRELEAGLAAVQKRAKEMLDALTKKR